jgi:hypothetical protein
MWGDFFMETTAQVAVEKFDKHRVKSAKWFTNWKFITTSIIIIIVLICAAISYYQANHFNANIKINGTNVGGLTTNQALKKLKTSLIKNIVYVGEQQILDGKDTLMSFTDKDSPAVKKLLKNQRTLIPSSMVKNYSLMPSKLDYYRSETLKKQVEEKLISMNTSLKAPQDADAHLELGTIVISPSIDGEQYDVASLLDDYQKQKYTSEIHLQPIFIKPLKEDSPIVKNKQKKLQDLLGQTLEYTVQDKVHTLTANELIKNATVSNDMLVTIDPSEIKNRIAEINSSQSTLDKDFTFKTHSGSVISVKGQGYGWALKVNEEVAQIKAAFEKGEKAISASTIHGHGWKAEGYGYETTTNNGIGDTYAEVSIAEQRVWIYKNGQLAVTTNIVSGKHSTGEDTSKGVWYILYKRTPSTLRGTHVGSGAYEVDVNYWAPFTNSGQGFHDASWRSNWTNNAYLTGGSGGCLNTPPSVMKTVFDNLSTYEPVVIY